MKIKISKSQWQQMNKVASWFTKKGFRVENLGPEVDKWCEETGNGSSTYDVCYDCHEELEMNPFAYDYKLVPYGNGEPVGSLGWGGDVDHPPYSDELIKHECAVCGANLSE